MAAYVIADVEVLDSKGFEAYRQEVPATIEQFGGRYIARGGSVVPLEGDWDPKRIVIIEFPSLDQARAWYDSAAYREPRALRQRTARTRLIIVEGL